MLINTSITIHSFYSLLHMRLMLTQFEIENSKKGNKQCRVSQAFCSETTKAWHQSKRHSIYPKKKKKVSTTFTRCSPIHQRLNSDATLHYTGDFRDSEEKSETEAWKQEEIKQWKENYHLQQTSLHLLRFKNCHF